MVAHNKMKAQMSNFVEQHVEFFKHCRIITTGSTGKTLEEKLGLPVYHKVSSGPLGGDQEIGAFVAQGKQVKSRSQSATTLFTTVSCAMLLILLPNYLLLLSIPGLMSAIFFFKDPLSAHQHAADIEALTRICDVHNVAYATNSASGKGLVSAMASLGLAFGISNESDTVKEYKADQEKVIRRLSMVNL